MPIKTINGEDITPNEVVDARVVSARLSDKLGTYDTAGDAIRGQVDYLYDSVYNSVKTGIDWPSLASTDNYPYGWRPGYYSVSSDGSYTTKNSQDYIRTYLGLRAKDGDVISIDPPDSTSSVKVVIISDENYATTIPWSTSRVEVLADSTHRYYFGVWFGSGVGGASEKVQDEEYISSIHGLVTTPGEAQSVSEETQRFCSLSMYEHWGVVGASRECGYLTLTSGTKTIPAVSWGKISSRMAGNDCEIYAKGGITSIEWVTNAQIGLPKLLQDEKLQLYVIGLGQNDAAKASTTPLGSESNVHANASEYTSEDLATTYGAYGYIVASILEYSPKSHVILLFRYDSSYSQAYLNVWNAVRYVAGVFSLPYANWCDYAMHQQYILPTTYRIGGHPTAQGYSLMAGIWLQMYSDIVKANWNYFKNYTGELS